MDSKAALPLPTLNALPLGAHSLLVLTDPALFERCGVRIAFTGRAGGVSEGCFASLNCGGAVGDEPQAVAENRRRVAQALGAEGAPLLVPKQVHGTSLVTVDSVEDEALAAAREAALAGADGLVVAVPDVMALLNFADCLPLILVAPSGRFAVLHAGWRGAVAGIAAKGLRALCQLDPCDPAEVNAYIGPHIRSCCFEVGPDVAKRFQDAFDSERLPGLAAAVPDADHVSLAAAVTRDLVGAGVLPERIVDAGICTQCNPERYFSYRATQGHCGRHTAAAFRPVRGRG